MIKALLLFFFTFGFIAAHAQYEENPVDWDFSCKKIAPNKYEVHFKAGIETPWHIYSQDSKSTVAQPTKFTFKTNPLLVFDKSPLQEKGELVQKEEGASGTLKYYNDEVDFIKVITLKSKVKTKITGTITYMVCTDEKCLPVTEKEFSIELR